MAMMDQFKKECGDNDECLNKKMDEMTEKATAEGKLPHVSWERIIDHIDHAVKLVGADHVGLGSDFDGANMPEGMDDLHPSAANHGSADAQGLQRRRHSQNPRRQLAARDGTERSREPRDAGRAITR